jgi:hypothetical protein
MGITDRFGLLVAAAVDETNADYIAEVDLDL